MENDSPLYGDHVSVSAVSSTIGSLSVQIVDHDQDGSTDQNPMMCEGGLLEQGVYQCTYLWLCQGVSWDFFFFFFFFGWGVPHLSQK
jgi:hypothetical protein